MGTETYVCPRCGGYSADCDLCDGKGQVTEEQMKYASQFDEKLKRILKKG